MKVNLYGLSDLKIPCNIPDNKIPKYVKVFDTDGKELAEVEIYFIEEIDE